ncbi:uncharacterized protein LOC119684244 [Teleopsis dalmanni]|uniref:uncharacterized protein LOC119684244 n=1 Tax=Teleopsis dalmanni TaxID=139649 RepID=UPI0018CE9A17|nr:uncharacterized protein LOC119684244 [Teleopsis dalmanni]
MISNIFWQHRLTISVIGVLLVFAEVDYSRFLIMEFLSTFNVRDVNIFLNCGKLIQLKDAKLERIISKNTFLMSSSNALKMPMTDLFPKSFLRDDDRLLFKEYRDVLSDILKDVDVDNIVRDCGYKNDTENILNADDIGCSNDSVSDKNDIHIIICPNTDLTDEFIKLVSISCFRNRKINRNSVEDTDQESLRLDTDDECSDSNSESAESSDSTVTLVDKHAEIDVDSLIMEGNFNE